MNDDVVVCVEARSVRYFFRGQPIHWLFLAGMLPAAWAFGSPVVDDQRWLGLTDGDWFRGCIVLAVVHQCYVWMVWRWQLGWQGFTSLFGTRDFTVFCAIFFPLMVARPLLVMAVAWADHGSLALPRWLSLLSGTLLLVPALVTSYSVGRYFGVARAGGGDHFREKYRRMPLVRRGVFQWTPNAMYTLVFFGLWSIAFLLQSHLALVAAVFQHGYIWAHYLGTEKPDMELLYAQEPDANGN